METSEMIYLATKAHYKLWSWEKLRYSDDLMRFEFDTDYVNNLTDLIYEYVDEIEAIGYVAFKDKYKGVKMFPN